MFKKPDLSRLSLLRAGATGDIAFAVLVSFSYLAMISASFADLTTTKLVELMGLGIVYILIGIYGYAFVTRKESRVWLPVYFCLQIPLSGLIVALGKGAGFNALLMMPLAGQSVVLFHRRGILATSIAILLIYVGAVDYYSGGLGNLWNNLATFLAGLVFVVVFTQLTVDQARARREVERLAQELEQANTQLREYAVQAEELAISRERNRLAREIHDGLGHYLTSIHMQIQAAQAVMRVDQPRANELLDKARTLTKSALEDVRQSVATLRSSPQQNRPLEEQIKGLLADVQSGDLKTEFILTGIPRVMNPQVELTCYRVVQEGLNNVRKHAHASQVLVHLDYSLSDKLQLTILDNGVGADGMQGGFGLIGLKERVHLVDGEINLVSTPGEGFSLVIEVPG